MENLTLETLPKAFTFLTNEVIRLVILFYFKIWGKWLLSLFVNLSFYRKFILFVPLSQGINFRIVSSRKKHSMKLQTIQNQIYEVRGQKVMLDFDLAELYETETKRLKEAVRRNIDRFPTDFMFELTREEYNSLRSQFASLENGRGKYSKFNPFAFTEQGVAMLASVLNSTKAIQVNIQIVRAFVFIRQYALSHKDLSDKLKELETRYNKQFKDVGEALNYLLQKDKQVEVFKKRKQIGFKTTSK